MLLYKVFKPALVLVAIFVEHTAGAAAIRLDSGDWDLVFSGDSAATSSVGFTMNFEASALGVAGSSVNVGSAGTLRLFDTTSVNSVDFNPFFDGAQISSGNMTIFSLEETNAAFSATGIDAGFRATWSAFDASGALLNQFQVGLFDLTGGQTAVEFNYDTLALGSIDTEIGYSSTLGTAFDLLSGIGVPIGDALGTGDFDPTFPDLCPATLDALACNNYYAGGFGPSDLILPDLAGGYFRGLSGSDPTPAQGRYLFLFGDVVDVAEPPVLALLGAAALAFGLSHRRRQRRFAGPAARVGT